MDKQLQKTASRRLEQLTLLTRKHNKLKRDLAALVEKWECRDISGDELGLELAKMVYGDE